MNKSCAFFIVCLFIFSYAEAQKPYYANVLDYGYNEADATGCIQKAIDSQARKVIVPYIGKPYIVKPLFTTADDQEIYFEPGVVLEAMRGEFHDRGDVLFTISGVKNVTLTGYGATFTMHKKDYQDSTLYRHSEHRHALLIKSSAGKPTENITVRGLHVESSGGDGLYVGGSADPETKIPYQPVNVLIQDVVSADNHRQGFSITGAEGLKVLDGVFINTKGTNPQAGVDWEPNANKMTNLEMHNCLIRNNHFGGIGIWLMYPPEVGPKGIQLTFNNVHVDSDPGVQRYSVSTAYITDRDGYTGTIVYNDCSFRNNNSYHTYNDPDWHTHVAYINMKSALRARVSFNRCLFEQTNKDGKVITFTIDLQEVKDNMTFGGVDFNNCIVNDRYDRPFITFKDWDNTGKGVTDIHGDIAVHNPFGADMYLGEKTENIGLNVKSVRTLPPEVNILEPELLQIFKTGDKYKFSANASDPDVGTRNGEGIKQVNFSITKGEKIVAYQEDLTAPYEMSGKMKGWEPGIYLLKAEAISSEFGSMNIAVTAFEIKPPLKITKDTKKRLRSISAP